ncbi:hypothetical protein, partial [Burkholderia cenocepacia]|uniref:hypothetical protein n=1 Tax=Burkholderia cenocepacia TaxID=95486 RepID=UPI003D1B82A5
APQLATLVDAPPTQGGWCYELKFDGYRILARIAGKGARRRVTLMTRALPGNAREDSIAVELQFVAPAALSRRRIDQRRELRR